MSDQEKSYGVCPQLYFSAKSNLWE